MLYIEMTTLKMAFYQSCMWSSLAARSFLVFKKQRLTDEPDAASHRGDVPCWCSGSLNFEGLGGGGGGMTDSSSAGYSACTARGKNPPGILGGG